VYPKGIPNSEGRENPLGDVKNVSFTAKAYLNSNEFMT
jgi:hypothetical protein